MSNIFNRTIPCELCATPTKGLATKRCDRCWELESRIQGDLEIARKILGPSEGDRIVALIREVTEEEGRELQIPHPNQSFDGPGYVMDLTLDSLTEVLLERCYVQGTGENYLECLESIKAQPEE